MSEIIANGVFTLAGTLIGSLCTWLISRDSKRTEYLSKNLIKLGEQIKSYWNLERMYANKLSELTQENKDTILKNYRKKIEDMGYTRPKMTENDVNDLLEDL